MYSLYGTMYGSGPCEGVQDPPASRDCSIVLDSFRRSRALRNQYKSLAFAHGRTKPKRILFMHMHGAHPPPTADLAQ